MKNKEKEKKLMDNLGFSSIKRIWPTISGQVTGILTRSLFMSLIKTSDSSTIGLIVISGVMLIIVLDSRIRELIKRSETYRNDKLWNTIVNDWMDTLYRFCIFMLLQYINFFASSSFSSSSNENDILAKLVYMFGSVFLLLFIVVVSEFLLEKKTKTKTPEDENTKFYSSSLEVFIRVYNGIYSVIVQFFTNFIYTDVIKLPNQEQVALVSFGILFFYMIIEHVIRRFINFFKSDENIIFYNFLMKFLDFMIVFAMFFSLQYIGMIIGNVSSNNNLGILERFVLLFSIYLISYSTFGFLVDVTNNQNQSYINDYNKNVNNDNTGKNLVRQSEKIDEKHEDNYFLITSIGRIWPTISGTTTSIFSSIIINEVIIGGNKTLILFTLIAFLFIYSILDSSLRDKILEPHFANSKEKEKWKNTLYELLDFPISLAALLLYNSLSDILTSQVMSGEINLLSQFVVIVSIQLVSISFFSILKFF